MHVAAWEMEHGPVPAGQCILHRCDRPPCFRLQHLFLGTKRDNSQDALSKGRLKLHPENLRPGYHGPVGAGHYKAKLTEKDAREARQLSRQGMTQRELAARYGVSQSTIWALLAGRSWRHLQEGGDAL